MSTPILIIDTQAHPLTTLTLALRRAGYSPIGNAHHWDDRRQHLKQDPELVLLSLSRPHALKHCQTIRNTPTGAAVPILLIGNKTQHGTNPELKQPGDALKYGADVYFPHPTPTDVVLSKIETLIGKPEARRAQAQAPKQAVAAASAPAPAATPPAATPTVASPTTPQAVIPNGLESAANQLLQQLSASPTSTDAVATARAPATSQAAAPPNTAVTTGSGLTASQAVATHPLPQIRQPGSSAATPPSHRQATNAAATTHEVLPATDSSTPIRSAPDLPTTADHKPRTERLTPQHDTAAALYRAWQHRYTGSLSIQPNTTDAEAGTPKPTTPEPTTIVLSKGNPVAVTQFPQSQDLPQTLARSGMLTRSQVDAFTPPARSQDPTRGPLDAVEALIQQGMLKPEEQIPALRTHLLATLFASFEHEAGSITWEQTRRPPASQVLLQDETPALVAEGIRRKHTLPRLAKRVGGPRTVVTPIYDGQNRAPEVTQLRLQAAEAQVLQALDGERSIADVLTHTGQTALTVYQALAILITTDAAEILVRSVESLEAQGNTLCDAIDRQRIQEKLHQVRHADYFAILGVSPATTRYEVQQAHQTLAHRFASPRFSALVQLEFKAELVEIKEVLADALDVLGDDTRRAAYGRFHQQQP